eukprot:3778806-Rhodomonas_salina.1
MPASMSLVTISTLCVFGPSVQMNLECTAPLAGANAALSCVTISAREGDGEEGEGDGDGWKEE